MGADFIEPDLVSTKDDVLVAPARAGDRRHDRRGLAGRSSPIAQDHEAARRVSRHRLVHRGLHPGRAQDAARGRAAARSAPAQHALQRAVRGPDVRTRCSTCAPGCPASWTVTIGVYPETKHPTYFQRARAAAGGAAASRPCGATGSTGRTPRSSCSRSRSTNLRELRRLRLRAGAVQLLSAPAHRSTPCTAGRRVRTPTSLRRPAWPRSPGTSTASARTSCRCIPPHRRRPRWATDLAGAPTRTRRAWSCTRTRSGAENHFLPADYRVSTDPTPTAGRSTSR